MPRGKLEREGARPVGRRATQRFAKERKSGSLLIGNRDLLWNTTDSWTDALVGLNPDIDADIIKHGVEDLFTRLARPGSPDAGVSGGGSQPAMASVAAPKYNVAGDILCMAHDNFRKRNYKEALRLFATAMETPDSADLIDGISEMNDQTDIGQQVNREPPAEDDAVEVRPSNDKLLEREIERALGEFSDEDEEEFSDEDEDEYSDDNSEEESDPDEDYSDEDEEEYSDEEADEDEEALAEVDDEIDNSRDESEDLADDETVPMGGTSSNSRARHDPRPEQKSDRMDAQAKIRALANKLSLTGTDRDRAQGSKVLRLKQKPKRR